MSLLLWVLVLLGLPLVFRLRSRVQSLEFDVGRLQRELDRVSEEQRRRRKEEERAAPVPPVVTPAPPPMTPAPPAVPPAPPPVRPSTPPLPPTEVPDVSPAFADGGEPPPAAVEPAWSLPRLNIDWEDLVGVKLFSAVAAIALVLAAVFFLRYSIDRGWLQPPVRVAIGVIVATALLVLCEMKTAKKYAVTTNALDAAAIAILFATFFAAHALWNLIPTTVTFGFLTLVTVLAVLLSIRHESRFIAVLGLLGGFATPALLSTGENQPIPLFTYLLLLNAGLAWVAFTKGWPVLTILTLIFTTIYQWGWVLKFLTANQLSLAMGIFLMFSIATFIALVMGRRRLAQKDVSADATTGLVLERTGLAASLMPLAFAIYLAAVPAFGANALLLFGFLVLLDAGLLAIAIFAGEEVLHVVGAIATLLVFATWLAVSYSSTSWIVGVLSVAICVALYGLASAIAARAGKPFSGVAIRAVYAAPLLLFVFPVIARIEPATASPALLFGVLFVLLALIAWRALATSAALLFFIAVFFSVAAEASWSATHLVAERLGAAIVLYAAFAVFYLGVPILARRLAQPLEPRWGSGATLIASLVLLLFLAVGPTAAAATWGMALLLAILNAGLFVETAAGRMPLVSAIGGTLSWIVLGVWWSQAAGAVGLLPSLAVLVGLTLVMLGGYAWSHAQLTEVDERRPTFGAFGRLPTTTSLGLVGHVFLFFVFQNPEWSVPPWPALGALFVMTLAAGVTSLFIRTWALHAAAVTAAALIVGGWTVNALGEEWASIAMVVVEAVIVYALAWLWIARRSDAHRSTERRSHAAPIGAAIASFIGELSLVAIADSRGAPPVAAFIAAHVANLIVILWLAWGSRWQWVAIGAVLPAWIATAAWHGQQEPAAWKSVFALAASLYAVFAAYPFVLGRRARQTRDPYLTAIAGSIFFLFAARSAFVQGGLGLYVGIIPVVEGIVLALLLRALLRIEPHGERDLARLAIVAGASLAFATVAIPLQLRQQWITIGWALEGVALAWLYRRIPHRGLRYSAFALFAVVFARLAMNPAVFLYEPRGVRVFNWYLYAYLVCAIAMFVAGWWLSTTDDELVAIAGKRLRASALLPPMGVILLFILLNIEIADFYASGPSIAFRFGVNIAQDLTYTVGWLVFGLGLLAAGVWLHSRPGRITAVALIAITMFKAFLYDMGSLGGLYRVVSLTGLAVSLALVALTLQKFVLQTPRKAS